MALRTANNLRIEQAIIAAARAHTQMPAFSRAKATELAAQIDATCIGARYADVTVALCIMLLKALGITDAHDLSRFSSH